MGQLTVAEGEAAHVGMLIIEGRGTAVTSCLGLWKIEKKKPKQTVL